MKRGGPGKGGGSGPLTPPSGHAYASTATRAVATLASLTAFRLRDL